MLFDKTHEELSTATSTYNKELEALMVNENIREMRLRIAKAKAIQQTKAYRTELRERTIRYLTNIQSAFSDQYKSTRSVLHNFRQQFFLTSKKESASRAVSDFLSTSQERINSLPVIYKNLYKIEPLADLELFVGRERELNQITEAYSNWMAGKMGSAILFGEKWSGMTSLLNYLQTSGSLKHPITRIKCETSLDSKGQFQHILRKILNTEEVAEYNITQEHLNSGPKRIVILEDIQNLYLRKTGGFDVVKSLLTMISNTSSNVFWLTSCTVYTWEYFKKTLSIHEIFSYPIGLQKPSEEDLSNIIQKRNRISGYKILFEADEDTRSSKRFGKMSSEEQQEHLRKKFFKNLIDFSESNVSMSLMFWLLSTKSVDQNQIVINSFQKPDLSFLGILKMDKVLALYALILHDGLTVEQFAQVMNCKTQAAFPAAIYDAGGRNIDKKRQPVPGQYPGLSKCHQLVKIQKPHLLMIRKFATSALLLLISMAALAQDKAVDDLKKQAPKLSEIFSIPKLFWSLVLVVAGWILIKLFSRILEVLAERSTRYRITLKGLIPVVRIIGWILVIITIITGIFQPPMATVLALSASVGVAVGFAAQDILKNIFGGVMILFDRPFQVGDKIEVGSFYGEVTQIGLRSTRIVTPDDSLVAIPNSTIMNGSVSNANSGEANCQVVAEIWLPAKC